MITGIIKNAEIRPEDHYGTALFFDIYVSESSAALTVLGHRSDLFAETLERVAYHPEDLNGKPCWVDDSKPGLLIFKKLWERF